MVPEHHVAGRRSFGLFEADLATQELWRSGRKVRLQSQPFKVLTVLLEHPGQVISRAELQTVLWGKEAIGDFDQSIGTAINKIRDALGDTADNPRFIETLARRGYRFIAPVSIAPEPILPPAPAPETHADHNHRAEHAPMASDATVSPAPPAAAPPFQAARPEPVPQAWWRRNPLQIASLFAFLLGLLVAGAILLFHPLQPTVSLLRVEQVTHLGRIAPGMPGMESLPAAATDGVRIFVPVLESGRALLATVDTHTGSVEPIDLPRELSSPTLGDLSPDLSTLLLRSHLSPESEQPLWTVPVGGNSALRVPNVIAHDATWMPDGKAILYAVQDRLMVHPPDDGAAPTVFATVPGKAFWLRWSPDGSLLRFTLLDPVSHTMSLWQINRQGKKMHKILDGWNQPASECCGVWADAGRSYVFQATRAGHTDLWRLAGNSTSSPIPLTNGPLNFGAPASSGSGSRVYFLGLDAMSLLQRYDPARSQFVPEAAFLADASRVEYSRDRSHVLWVDQAGRAWCAQADGSERLELTPHSLQVFMAQWSPDGSQIALMARESGKAWQLYLVSADGGSLRHLQTDSRNVADPSWSPDGTQIVFGRVNDEMGNDGGPRRLEVLTLSTGAIAAVPGSTSLFSPRWSPNGRYIAAISLDQHQLTLFDTTTQQWRAIAQTSAADPVWADNSAAIYFHASLAENQPIYRASIPDGHLQQVVSLANFSNTPTDYFFSGLDPGGAPIVRSRTATGDVYTLDLEQKATSTRP